MFNNAAAEISDGMFRLTESLHGIEQRVKFEVSGGHSSNVSRTLKGLFFVQMYALYERTVNVLYVESASEINGLQIRLSRAVPGLVVLHCSPQFRRLKDVAPEHSWATRGEVVRMPLSAGAIFINENEFPVDGTHYRSDQLRTMCSLFGIHRDPLSHPRLHARLGEIVETRNAVAHGRIMADRIGQRFSEADLWIRHNDLTVILNELLLLFRDHFSKPTNLHR